MTAATARPACQVLPTPAQEFPDAHAIVSPVLVPTYAGHWGKPGTAHAGMWVIPFPTEVSARKALARLQQTGHTQ